MKRFLLLSILLTVVMFTKGQDYFVSFNGKDYSENDTLIVYGDPTVDTISFFANFNNGSADGVNFGVVRDQVSPHGGTSNFFTWGDTYNNYTDTSSVYLFIPAGNNSPDGYFQGHYLPNNIVGISYINYIFYNINVPEDRFSLQVIYNTVAYGVEENWLDDNILYNPYPNPATILVNLDFESGITDPINYYLTNLSGRTLMEGIINPGMSGVNIDVSILASGLYLIRLVSQNGTGVSKKILINR